MECGFLIYSLDSMLKHPSLIRNEPESAKFRLFRVFHRVVKDYNVPRAFYLAALLIEALQMFYYCIHPSFPAIWSSPLVLTLQKALSFIGLSQLWTIDNNVGIIVWSVLVLCSTGAVLSIVCYEVLKDPAFITQNTQDFTIKVIQYSCLLFRTILVIPVVSCTIQSFVELSRSTSLSSIIATVLSILSCFSFLTILGLTLFLYTDDSPFSPLPFALSPNQNELKKNGLKVYMAAYGILVTVFPQTSISILFGISLLAGLLYLLHLAYISPNIIDPLTRTISECSLAVMAWSMLALLVQSWITPGETLSLVFSGFGCVLSGVAWVWVKERRAAGLLFESFSNLMKKEDILSYVYLMCEMVRGLQEGPMNLMLLEGMLSEHIFQCKKSYDNCFCQELKESLRQYNIGGGRVSGRKEARSWFEYIKSNLTVASEKYHDPEYYLLLASVEMNILRNNFRTYKNLELIRLPKESLKNQFLCYHQKRIIENQLMEEDERNNERKTGDVNSFFNYSLKVRQLQEEILKSSLEHLSFWEGLKSSTSRNQELIIRDGNRLEVSVKENQRLFKEISDRHPHSLLSLVLYCNYCKYILNDYSVIESFKETVVQIRRKIIKEPKISGEIEKEMYSDNANSGVIIISGQRDNIGVIKYCTSKVTDILKYPIHELIGQNINVLMPKFIGNMHNEVLYNYLELAESQFDFVERLAPMMDRNSFMILARILTKPFPSLLNGLELVGIFESTREIHIKHPTESPKYLLYRSDSGKVESVSETFHEEYGFRVVKIDKFSEVSSELYFNTLFYGISESEVRPNENGFNAEIRSIHNSKRTEVKIYLRHQINYFGVKLKLLQLFRKEEPNFNMLAFQDEIKNLNNSEFSHDHLNTLRPEKLEQTIKEVPKEGPKHRDAPPPRFNHMKDKPLKLKLFHLLFLFLQAATLFLSSLQLYYNFTRLSIEAQSIDHLQASSDSIIQLSMVGFYSRLLSMSATEPGLDGSFGLMRANASVFSSSLQNSEFWLVNRRISGHLSQDKSNNVISWSINEGAQVSSSPQSLRLGILDLVTSASTFNSATPPNMAFDPILLGGANDPLNALFRNLVHIRYSSLYSLIEAKEAEHSALIEEYKRELKHLVVVNTYQAIFGSLALLILFLCLLLMVWRLLYLIFDIISLFTFLTPFEIEKEVEKCMCFLDTCFNDEYEIKLLHIGTDQIQSNNSFQASNNFISNRGPNSSFRKTFDVSVIKEHQEDEEGIDVILQEKKLTQDKPKSDRSIKALMGEDNAEPGEHTPLNGDDVSFNSIESAEPGDFFGMNQTKKNSLYIILLAFLLTFAYYLSNCIYSYSASHSHIVEASIKDTLHFNLRLLSEVQYYSLEAAVDDSAFAQYPLLSESLVGLISNLYKEQRNLFGKAEDLKSHHVGQQLTKKNSDSLCSGQYGKLINFGRQQFSVQECEQVKGSVLKLGLRPGIVAFVQTLRQISTLGSASDVAASPLLNTSLVLGKYVAGSLQLILEEEEKRMRKSLRNEQNLYLGVFIVFMFGFNVGVLLLNFRLGKWIVNKINGTNRILSLIPHRIFQKNDKLAEGYQQKRLALYGE